MIMHFHSVIDNGRGRVDGIDSRKERWIGWASAACAVHCAGSPALVLVLPAAAFGEVIEQGLLVALLVLAVVMLVHGVRRHGNWRPALPVAAALALWVSALGGVAEGMLHAGVIGAGGMFSFWGLRWNRQLVEACSCESGCGCETAGGPE